MSADDNESGPEPEVLDVDSEEVLGRLRAAVDRALVLLSREAPAITLATAKARAALVEALREDAACVALLHGAYLEGGEDAALRDDSGAGPRGIPVPDWSDAPNDGALLVARGEEHACLRCVYRRACVVAREPLVEEALVAVSRCRLFLPVLPEE